MRGRTSAPAIVRKLSAALRGRRVSMFRFWGLGLESGYHRPQC